METVLITGGAGSLGGEIVRAVLKRNPKSVRIFDNSEYSQWQLGYNQNDDRLRFLIGDIRDKDRLHRAMNGVDTVIHAAALKHVPLCEYNPIEAVETNINGSVNVIDTAIDNKVEKVIAISSDKAVHPINIYGATKLVMEKLFVQANVYGETKFSCIRFGNFEGSKGSLVQIIEKQLEDGDEITLTDKEMTRFWLTLESASEFTLRCIDKMEGGEIFIPKMPETYVEDVIHKLAPNAKYKIIGKRVGEKLHELLWSEAENDIIQDKGDYFLIAHS